MTTIVFRDGILAADTGQSTGDSLLGHVSKIARSPKGDLAGAAGNACHAEAFRRWFVDGEQGDPPKFSADDKLFARGVIFRRDGTIEVYEPEGMFRCRAPYYAFGSGRPEALGALFMGASAAQAVEAAIEHDAHTCGEVETLRHDEPLKAVA